MYQVVDMVPSFTFNSVQTT